MNNSTGFDLKYDLDFDLNRHPVQFDKNSKSELNFEMFTDSLNEINRPTDGSMSHLATNQKQRNQLNGNLNDDDLQSVQNHLNKHCDNHEIVFRKKKNLIDHQPDSQLSIEQQKSQYARSSKNGKPSEHQHFKKSNVVSSSNLNAKLERKSTLKRGKRSSLEPLLDGIDPNRKSVENLFHKLYLNQVNGDELTDQEISNVYRKSSLGELNHSNTTNSCHSNQPTGRSMSATKPFGHLNKVNSNGSSNSVSSNKQFNLQIDQDEFNYLITCSNQNLTQNLTKNLSKISCANLNDERVICSPQRSQGKNSSFRMPRNNSRTTN